MKNQWKNDRRKRHAATFLVKRVKYSDKTRQNLVLLVTFYTYTLPMSASPRIVCQRCSQPKELRICLNRFGESVLRCDSCARSLPDLVASYRFVLCEDKEPVATIATVPLAERVFVVLHNPGNWYGKLLGVSRTEAGAKALVESSPDPKRTDVTIQDVRP